MSRLEKKCFIGSAALHGLLLVVFFCGSAFFNSSHKAPPMPPVITIMAMPTDKALSTGGSRQGTPTPPAPAPAPEPVTPPAPTPPAPTPEPPRPVKPQPEPEPPKSRETVKVKPAPEKSDFAPKKDAKKEKEKPDPKDTAENTSAKPARNISTKVIKRTNDTVLAASQAAAQKRSADHRAQQQAIADFNRQQQAFASRVGGVVNGVGQHLGKNTVVEPLGDGGAAFANWGSLVAEIYKRAVHASHPQSDDDAVAVIRVTVARSGSVKDTDWKRRTGDPQLDKAVERAMRSVRVVPEFPKDSTDSERSFNINIGFEAKRVTT